MTTMLRAALLPCIATFGGAVSFMETQLHTDFTGRQDPVSSGEKIAWNSGVTDAPEYFFQLGWPFVQWSMCEVAVHSNLGGLGPDVGEESVRYSNIWSSGDGRGIDMVVTANNSYTPKSVSQNGLVKGNGCFGQINVAASSSVELLFSFYLTGTNTSVAFEEFYFSLFDLDRSTSATETATFFSPAEAVTLNQDTELLQSGDFASGLSLTATGFGNAKDNPKTPEQLGDSHRKRAGMVKYLLTTQFKVVLAVEGGRGGRNFVFAGFSNVQDTPAPTPPTPSPTLSPDALPTPAPTELPGAVYTVYWGQHCLGSEPDVKTMSGTAQGCMEKCSKMPGCSGFVRVNSNSQDGHNGKCWLRGGTVSTPYEYTHDNRDCYILEVGC